MVNYGFCFQDNLYNSLKFFVNMDIDMYGPIKVHKIIAAVNQKENIQQIRLKKD